MVTPHACFAAQRSPTHKFIRDTRFQYMYMAFAYEGHFTHEPRAVTMKLHGEVTPLSSWTPRAAKKNLLLVICITKTSQNFINFFSWVDIHGTYYIVENDNQIWGFVFLIKHTVSN
jgi:hypothetical protein